MESNKDNAEKKMNGYDRSIKEKRPYVILLSVNLTYIETFRSTII